MKYNIGWGLTNKCNMNCAFCYSKQTREVVEELKIENWIKFIDENHDQIETINYGTGENVILDDFFTFVEYVRANYPKIKQSLTTNGYLYARVINNDKYLEIYRNCIDEVDVSLDFCNKDMHCAFRGQPLSYDWAINTLKMLKNDKKLATIVFVGFNETLNKENIDGLFTIAKEYDAMIRLNIYRPVSDSKEINQKFTATYDCLVNALEYMMKKYKTVSLSDILFGNIYCDDLEIFENTGIDSIRILPNGDICPSTYLISSEFRKYNIQEDDILSKIEFNNFINAPIPNECVDCKIVNKCKGGVYDRRILWNKTLDKKDPYCPILNGDKIEKEKVKIKKKGRISVHDGYLPTMFFKNN